MKKLTIEYQPVETQVYTVRLIGELGMASVRTLVDVIDNVFAKGVSRIMLDLSDTTYIASSGIGIIIASTESARARGGDLILVGATSRVRHVFRLMGLDCLLRFADTPAQAMSWMKRTA
jgi:anti-sigma B factor antagonist